MGFPTSGKEEELWGHIRRGRKRLSGACDSEESVKASRGIVRKLEDAEMYFSDFQDMRHFVIPRTNQVI